MDFVVGISKTLVKYSLIWLIVDQFVKLAHFFPVWVDYNSKKLDKTYVKEIVRLHVVPIS